MAISAYLKAFWTDWLAKMTGPLSLILVLVPLVAPGFTTKRLGGSTLFWIFSFVCLVASGYRAWLAEHRARLAEKLDPLIEDVRLLRELWDDIQFRYKDSQLVRFPLSGFDVERWEEEHKQLLRLFFWTSIHAGRAASCLSGLGITEGPCLTFVMNNQDARRSLDALGYAKLLEQHTALLAKLRAQITGGSTPSPTSLAAHAGN